ncbi:MAG: DNA translocase FtsK 4TM domain-containing protein [Holosporales bacterium]|jgi:S-DNA-T family DNA segregation ATPase FtsK/SpoIIIE|nr:DNA translocase FtsK 4TM domain-containing protein [Holosporales bacterium]
MKLTNWFGGVFIIVSTIISLSLYSYTVGDSCLSTVTNTKIVSNLIGNIGAYIADIFTCCFGFFTYMIVLLLFIWGWKIITDRIQYIKRKSIMVVLFIVLGTIVFTGISSYFDFKINYLAGGIVGYILTKLIFVDIIKNFYINISLFFIILFSWLFVSKTVFFIDLQILKNKISRILSIFRLPIKNNNNYYINNQNINEIAAPSITNSRNTPNSKKNTISDSSGSYNIPPHNLLDKPNIKNLNIQLSNDKINTLSNELCNVLEEFGVNGEIINVKQGPVVTMFEFRPAAGIKTSRVISLADDIARSMSAVSARISLIPGQNAIGIELPNKVRQTVYFLDLLTSENFMNFKTGIPLILGKDISGNPVMADLTKMPHLLVAGTTGSGKSVSINDMILSILFKFSPNECKLIMIDPKMLELSVYDEIPHLLTPVVTEPKKAIFALKWAVSEMENRYRQMSKLGVRNIDGFNKKLSESREKGDLLVRKVQTGFDQDTGRPIFETQHLDFKPMPYIVIIVDEMADLMLVAGKDIEAAVQRLAQMARAAGIHLIMATQRPSVDVITGTIKANFPTRISFQVTSKIDSRTILGEQGAEQLLGQGDMLYMVGGGRITRIHGPFVKDLEVERIVEFVKEQGEPSYVDIISDIPEDFGSSSGGENGGTDDMYNKAIEIIQNDKKVSISYLQRKLNIGYNRAAKIIEEMEERGVVSAPSHTGKREILV